METRKLSKRRGNRKKGYMNLEPFYCVTMWLRGGEGRGLRALHVEPIPADIGEAPGYTLDRLQVHHRAAVLAIQHLNMPYKLRLF